MTNLTFTMIKPDAVNHSPTILQLIEANGFKIIAQQRVQLTPEQASQFYQVHAERSFFPNLVQYMSSGEVIAMVLQKENAVVDFRTFIGATDPTQAAVGTIRQLYGRSLEANAIHGSDSDENARLEAHFFFPTQF